MKKLWAYQQGLMMTTFKELKTGNVFKSLNNIMNIKCGKMDPKGGEVND